MTLFGLRAPRGPTQAAADSDRRRDTQKLCGAAVRLEKNPDRKASREAR